MNQRAPKILKQWGLFFAALILLHGLLFLAWAVLEPQIMRSPAIILPLMAVYLILFAVIMLVFFRRVGRATAPPEYEEAREQGIPATAKVLDIRRTHWRVRPRLTFRLQYRPMKREYMLRVRVTQAGKPDYEAEFAEFIYGANVPDKGEIINVKVHPQRPEVIVIAQT